MPAVIFQKVIKLIVGEKITEKECYRFSNETMQFIKALRFHS